MRRISERGWFAGIAAVGIIVSHALSYLLIAPDPHARVHLLQQTGHHYFTWVAAIAIGMLVAGLAGGTVHRLRPRPSPELSTARVFALSAVVLVALQIIGFVALESAERAGPGGGFAHVLTEPAVGVGILMQVVVALIGAFLLVSLARGVDRISSRLLGMTLTGRVARVVTWWATSVLPPALQVAASGRTLRGPPSL